MEMALVIIDCFMLCVLLLNAGKTVFSVWFEDSNRTVRKTHFLDVKTNKQLQQKVSFSRKTWAQSELISLVAYAGTSLRGETALIPNWNLNIFSGWQSLDLMP